MENILDIHTLFKIVIKGSSTNGGGDNKDRGDDVNELHID